MTPAKDDRWNPRRAVRLRRAVRRFVPRRFSFRLRQEGRRLVPAPGAGTVDFGDLRRIYPVSRKHGWERGQPSDRYYIERFLERHRGDVRGRVLDVCDRLHSSRYGGRATIVADIADSSAFSPDMFDCVLLTQTLQFVFEVSAAVQSLDENVDIKAQGNVLSAIAFLEGLSSTELSAAELDHMDPSYEVLVTIRAVKR